MILQEPGRKMSDVNQPGTKSIPLTFSPSERWYLAIQEEEHLGKQLHKRRIRHPMKQDHHLHPAILVKKAA